VRDRIFYDLSEFVAHPLRTGIQRVSFEILRHWKFSPQLAPGFISLRRKQPMLLPEAFRPLMERLFVGDGDSGKSIARKIISCARRARLITSQEIRGFSGFLNPELFLDARRAEFYRVLAEERSAEIHWVVYDALPWLSPDTFPKGAVEGTMHYLKTMRVIPNLHFISASCREDFCERILRCRLPTYRVCPLGADGLGRAAPSFDPRKRGFSCVGTIEPRKNHKVILEAFEALWSEGVDARLTFIGRMGWDSRQLGDHLKKLAQRESRFGWYDDLDDARLRDAILASRATIYASEREGFGLPPLESLALGIPVIVSSRLPSISNIATGGQIRIEDITPASIVAAVKGMLDDGVAERKYAELQSLDVPIWQEMAHSLRDAMSAR